MGQGYFIANFTNAGTLFSLGHTTDLPNIPVVYLVFRRIGRIRIYVDPNFLFLLPPS